MLIFKFLIPFPDPIHLFAYFRIFFCQFLIQLIERIYLYHMTSQ